MTFLYPLGFLALIAIPVLIFIYIIKNRYTEQTIASTYLWTLSEKFLRRRVPINMITGILSLILQCLIVFLIAVILTQPIISIPNAANEYCFILDGSGSMNIAQGDSTRFEEAKKEIAEIIDDSMNGSTYTLIYAGDSTGTIYENYGDKARAMEVLNDLEISYTSSNLSNALGVAQRYFNEHPSVLTYVVTDRTYAETKNVTVINVASATENYGIADVTYKFESEQLKITGLVTSYGSDAELTLNIYFDGSDELYDTKKISVKSGVDTEFEYFCDKTSFSNFKVVIAETDSLALDNEVVVYNVKQESMSPTLVVYGKTVNQNTDEEKYVEPFLLKAALTAAGNRQLTFTTDVGYNAMSDEQKAGYGLYIFNNCVPNEMPREGVVWFINPTASVPGSRFSHKGSVTAAAPAVYSTNSSSSIQSMLAGISQKEFNLHKYVKLGTSGKFTTYISCEGNPLLMAGLNDYGNREVVFAFDLNASALFTMTADCTTILSRFLSYSFPEVVESTSFYCGDTLQINKISGCQSIRVDTPLGKSEYPDTSTAISEYALSEVGVYTIHLTMKDNSERDLYVYSSLPVAERSLSVTEMRFNINGQPGEGSLPGIIDDLLIIFIILAVIAVADYGVYCYEQYQLR